MNYMLRPYSEQQLTGDSAIGFLEERLQAPVDELIRFPRYIYIEPVNYCNARCVMCGIDFDAKNRVTKTISDNLFGKLVEELSTHRDEVEKVMLYLDCEPLVDRHLHDKVRKLKQAGIRRVNIATNASIMKKNRSQELIEAGLDEIYITIDSLKKDVYEKIRVGLRFEDVIANTFDFIEVRNSLNPGLTVRIQAILQEANADEVDSIPDYWSKYLRETDQVVIQRIHNWGGALEVMKFGDESGVNNLPCKSLWGTFCVHIDGVVGLCTMDTARTVEIGDLNRQTIEEVWQGTALNQIRQCHLTGRRKEVGICDGCTHWREEKREVTHPDSSCRS